MIHLQLDVRSIPTKNLTKGFDSNCFLRFKSLNAPRFYQPNPPNKSHPKVHLERGHLRAFLEERGDLQRDRWIPWRIHGTFTYFYLHGWLIFHGKCREILPSTHGSNGEWTIFAEFDHFWASKSHQRGPKCLQQKDHLYTGLTWVGGKRTQFRINWGNLQETNTVSKLQLWNFRIPFNHGPANKTWHESTRWQSTLAFRLAFILEGNQDLGFETQNASETDTCPHSCQFVSSCSRMPPRLFLQSTSDPSNSLSCKSLLKLFQTLHTLTLSIHGNKFLLPLPTAEMEKTLTLWLFQT